VILFILNFSLKKSDLVRGPYLFQTKDDIAISVPIPSEPP